MVDVYKDQAIRIFVLNALTLEKIYDYKFGGNPFSSLIILLNYRFIF